MNNLTEKNWVPHPGEYIKEELEERGWTQRDLAFILGCPEQSLNLLLTAKKGVSAEMTKALGDAFNVPPELFSNLQRAYDLAHTANPSPSIAKRARIQSKYPIREMIKRGWLDNDDASLLEEQIARHFCVDTITDVPHLAHAAKKTAYDEIPAEQLAWLFRVKQIAKTLKVNKYSHAALREIVPKLKQLLIDPEEIRNVPRLLIGVGVRLIFVEALPSSKIDGVSFWLDDNSPVIGMSLRLDRIDNYWFVLRHEIEHILNNHGKEHEIIDTDMTEDISDAVPVEENIANTAASDFCVSQRDMDLFIARKDPFFSDRDVRGFAQIMQVHPGIIAGQLQYKTKDYRRFKSYQIKIRQFALNGAIVDGWGQVFPITL
jgi:HTH-type transcriptional regulator/antitoxin HigA